METKLTEQQSLGIITEMIERARTNVQKGSGTYMVYYGSIVSIIALLNIVLIYSLKNPINSFWIWCGMIPVVIFEKIWQGRKDKEVLIRTHIDHIISSVWAGFLITQVIFLILIFGSAIYLNDYRFYFLITPVILLSMGLAEFVTAQACRFKPFLYGAIAMWVGALACLATLMFANPVVIQFLILPVCMTLGFVIPGYKLNKMAK